MIIHYQDGIRIPSSLGENNIAISSRPFYIMSLNGMVRCTAVRLLPYHYRLLNKPITTQQNPSTQSKKHQNQPPTPSQPPQTQNPHTRNIPCLASRISGLFPHPPLTQTGYHRHRWRKKASPLARSLACSLFGHRIALSDFSPEHQNRKI